MIKKILASLLLLLSLASFTVQESPIEGLSVVFRKISGDYVIPVQSCSGGALLGSIGAPIEAHKGMRFLKLKIDFKNEGNTNCKFKLNEIFLSTEQDSLYQVYCFQGTLNSNEVKLKPTKELTRTLVFEFPDKAKPKELFIEDKRYKVEISKEKEAEAEKTIIKDYEDKD